MKNKIVLTGGGSAGHVTPNLSLIPDLQNAGWEIHYIGTKKGIESKVVPKDSVIYHSVKAGKWRRYFDWKNLTDIFNVFLGICKSTLIIRKIKPNVIFSKGGFVSVPIVIGGWLNRVPVILHESDLTPGLANKLSTPFAQNICTSFAETLDFLPKNKSIHVGSPIRQELISGDASNGLSFCGFVEGKPILMVLGGSLGSVKINKLIRDNIYDILNKFQIVHICGKGKLDKGFNEIQGYRQFEYVQKEMADLFKITDIAVGRAGSNSIFEFLYLKIPSLLIPLPKTASRGDQILNAAMFSELGYSKMLQEENLTDEAFLDALDELFHDKEKYIQKMMRAKLPDGKENIVKLINQFNIERNVMQ
ncbi:undecaprenyldiphospho-muramoylpentapeptide beta-N-acetylglucosaminyltransferase [Paenibacillus tundrae]